MSPRYSNSAIDGLSANLHSFRRNATVFRRYRCIYEEMENATYYDDIFSSDKRRQSCWSADTLVQLGGYRMHYSAPKILAPTVCKFFQHPRAYGRVPP